MYKSYSDPMYWVNNLWWFIVALVFLHLLCCTWTTCSLPILSCVYIIIAQEDAPTLRILQLSDIHLDENYAVGSNTNCGEPLCCRASHGSPSTPSAGAGYWGDYRDCDIPPRTFDSLLNHLRTGEKVVFEGSAASCRDSSISNRQIVIFVVVIALNNSCGIYNHQCYWHNGYSEKKM